MRQIEQPLPPLITIIHYGSARAWGSLTAIDLSQARGRPSISSVDFSFFNFFITSRIGSNEIYTLYFHN